MKAKRIKSKCKANPKNVPKSSNVWWNYGKLFAKDNKLIKNAGNIIPKSKATKKSLLWSSLI